MRLIWSRKLYTQDPWEPYFRGVFSYRKSGISFYYEDGGAVKCICGCTDTPATLLQPSREHRIPLPHHWMIVEQEGERYLLCGEEAAIHLGPNLPISPVPDGLCREYRRQQMPASHFVEDSFTFEEYQIRHKGEWGYSCQKNGTEIWKFVGHGYLYTGMFRKADHLYFGTAGAGGYFYILDIHTGVPVLSLRTGGTTVILQRGSCGYLYTGVGKKKSQLICVDFSSGEIMDEIELPGTVSSYSVLGLWEDCIYTVTFQYKKGCVINAVFSCISLNESVIP